MESDEVTYLGKSLRRMLGDPSLREMAVIAEDSLVVVPLKKNWNKSQDVMEFLGENLRTRQDHTKDETYVLAEICLFLRLDDKTRNELLSRGPFGIKTEDDHLGRLLVDHFKCPSMDELDAMVEVSIAEYPLGQKFYKTSEYMTLFESELDNRHITGKDFKRFLTKLMWFMRKQQALVV